MFAQKLCGLVRRQEDFCRRRLARRRSPDEGDSKHDHQDVRGCDSDQLEVCCETAPKNGAGVERTLAGIDVPLELAELNDVFGPVANHAEQYWEHHEPRT